MLRRKQNIFLLKSLFFSAFLLVVTSLFSNSKQVHFEHESDQNLFTELISDSNQLSLQIRPFHHGNAIPETPTDGTEQSQTEKESEKESENDNDNDDDNDFYRQLVSESSTISYSIKAHACLQKTGFYFSLPFYVLFHSWKSFVA